MEPQSQQEFIQFKQYQQ